MLEVSGLIEEYPEEVRYDLLRMGFRLRDLGTDLLSWADAYTIIRSQPSTYESALYRAVMPEEAAWESPFIANSLLAVIADALHVGNWQRGRGKKSDYPKPIQRPGVDDGRQKFGKKPIPLDEMDEWLGWNTKE